ncbi:IgA Peptidase M64 [Planctomycetes bacterium Poly30]|uniref:IgA Peptidase M64 n=1 Tax=Saltatorellus ferox TaxID=2528018 RepID=A0A518ET04_9BACT|nr:IgA Peptidase M64 [Planctomycetes bacterium Poly30]
MKVSPIIALVFLAAAAPPSEEKAERMLEKAELRAEQGKFDEAQALYRRLAKQFPGTPEGAIGERRGKPSAYLGFGDVVRHGPSENRLDFVLMGEGYQITEMSAFAKLAADVPDVFERNEVFGEYYRYLNFLRADLVSADNGVDGYGRDYDTALNGKTLGTFAGHVGIDRNAVRAMLSEMPEQDGQAIVFAKLGILGTGGGGVATIGGRNMATMIHEIGHSFGGLSDEYTAQQAGRPKDAKPSRNTNIAISEDPEECPWNHFLKAKVRGVGMHPGGAQFVQGAWRPTAGKCAMASSGEFCPVCREELVLRIYSYCDPIDAAEPQPHPFDSEDDLLVGRGGLHFEVTVLQPTSHELQVDWWVLPEGRAPRPIDVTERKRRRAKKGESVAIVKSQVSVGPGGRRVAPPVPIEEKPARSTHPNHDGVHKFRVTEKDLGPGRFRVVCRVHDTTEVRGSQAPWVVKEDVGFLTSTIGWWVRAAE